MAAASIPEVHYRLAGPAGGGFPGHHRSRSGEGGFEFRRHAALADAPDARRLDLHASLRDPFGQWRVRLNSLRQSIPVAVAADLSASMGFAGVQRRLDVLADFTQSIAWSAWRTGDSFAFAGADDTLRRDWLLPATRQRGAGLALAQRLRGFEPTGRSARGLRDTALVLPQRRALVFLVSDFHLPLPELRGVLGALSHHALVPVLLAQREEAEPAASRGLVELEDPETGLRRWVWWRPALRERWRAAGAARRAALLQLFAQARLAPLVMDGAYDADAVTRYFLA